MALRHNYLSSQLTMLHIKRGKPSADNVSIQIGSVFERLDQIFYLVEWSGRIASLPRKFCRLFPLEIGQFSKNLSLITRTEVTSLETKIGAFFGGNPICPPIASRSQHFIKCLYSLHEEDDFCNGGFPKRNLPFSDDRKSVLKFENHSRCFQVGPTSRILMRIFGQKCLWRLTDE